MARIADAKGRSDGNSAYVRLLGDQELGQLISRVQSAVISSGTELERMIRDRVARVDDLDEFLQVDLMPDGVFLAHKRQLKSSVTLQTADTEPDFVIFKRRNNEQRCHVVELKDGDSFDTKKSAGERNALHSYVEKNSQFIPFIVEIHVVAFNQNNRQAIYDGFKRKVPIQECMTGREFCELLEIDYDAIVDERRQDAVANFDHFLSEMLKIKRVENYLRGHLRS